MPLDSRSEDRFRPSFIAMTDCRIEAGMIANAWLSCTFDKSIDRVIRVTAGMSNL